MVMENLDSENLPRIGLAALLVLFWLFTPIYIQKEYGYSAIQISFLITVVYYIGFKLWKHFSSENATV